MQAVPALRAVGAGARVTFCGQPRLGSLLAGTGVVDEAVSFDGFGLDALFSREPAPRVLAEKLGRFQEIMSWFGSRDARYVEQLRAIAPGCVVAPPQPGVDAPADRGRESACSSHLSATVGEGARLGAIHRGGARAVPVAESAAALRSTVPGADSTAARPLTVWEHLLATVGTLHPRRRRPTTALATSAEVEADEGRGLLIGPLVVPQAWRADGLRALHASQLHSDKPVLFVHPGAGGVWKLAPPDLLARVISSLMKRGGIQVLVHAGPADREAADQLVRLLDAPTSLLVEPPLTLLAGVLSCAAGYLGGDSGLSHLAAAVGTPAIILFPAATLGRWAPWSQTARPISMEGDQAAVASAATAALSEAISAWRSPGP